MPPAIADYVILHELMHLREQNHSRRFWRLVEDVCPDYRDAERWLRRHGPGFVDGRGKISGVRNPAIPGSGVRGPIEVESHDFEV